MAYRVMTLNPERRYSDGFNALDWIDTSSDRALLEIQSVVSGPCGETSAERYEDYFRHPARAVLGGLLTDIFFSHDLKPEVERRGLGKIRPLESRTSR